MKIRAARLSLATLLLVCSSLLAAVSAPERAAASHVPSPAEIVMQLGDLPPGFAPADDTGSPALLPDGLARQATARFERASTDPAEPGVRFVRQVVLAFDERDATEYVSRFSSLMVRHQGYVVLDSSESAFRLRRDRDGETSVVATEARADVLIVTTVSGLEGTVGPDDAARLTRLAVARVPVVEQASAALSTEPGAVSLAGAQTGPGHLDIPNQQDAARWPQPITTLPGPPSIGVAQARSGRPVGDASLDGLLPPPRTAARPPHWPATLGQYVLSMGPLLDEFWSRALAMTNVDYHPPRFVVVPEGVVVMTACLEGDGEPAQADSLSYCPADETVYIYEPFMREDVIAGQDWRARDYVVATVVAHEWGHHIQKLTGLSLVSGALIMNDPRNWPLITRQKELQADCFAGMFTRYTRDRQWLNAGDLAEAQEALLRAGDDHLDSPGHHGLPEQRKEWFMRGYVHYAFRSCEPW